MLDAKVRDFLENNRSRNLETLLELLRIPSVANADAQPHPCRKAADWLGEYCRNLGMDAEVLETDGQPCVFATARASDAGAPTLLVYGHYDVQPAAPVELWESEPFQPMVRDGCVYGRGASDDKGQLFAHLAAIEAWRQAGAGLPVNIKLLLEGEEEVGSPNLEPFVAGNAERLSADAAVISDGEFFAEGLPSITYSLRGLAYFEVRLTGPAVDLHSGTHGGAVTNPANALAKMISAMHDADGRVTPAGYYDDVLGLDDAERAEWEALDFDEDAYARSLGLEALGGGEKGFSALERRWARPTLDCNGIVGGYTEPGSKTIIPSEASAKLSCRLVPNQDPRKVVAVFKQFVAEHTPAGIRADVRVNATARPVLLPTDSPAMSAGASAMEEAFGRRPALVRCGASVPVTELIQRLLGLDAVLMGFGLPSGNIHSPNEHLRLEQFHRGALAAAAFYRNLADELTSPPS